MRLHPQRRFAGKRSAAEPSIRATERRNEPALPALAIRQGWTATAGARRNTEDRVQSRMIAETEGQRTFALVIGTGGEVMACLQEFADQEQVSAAAFSAIGAFSDAVLSRFDREVKDYRHNPAREQVKVASLSGDAALAPDGQRPLHIHAVPGRQDGSAPAGDLSEAHVRPTPEVILTESPAHLRKCYDPESGLVLIRLDG